jgi:hypothetical protein
MAEMPESVKVQRKLKRGGRPPIISAELIRSIASLIATGAPMYTVAAANGIHRDTINDWLAKGAKAKSGIYKEFSVAVKEAAAQGRLRHFENIRQTGDGYDVVRRKVVQKRNDKGELEIVETTTEQSRERQWTASAWILERMDPETFGRRAEVKMTGDPEKPVAIELTKPIHEDPEKMADFIAALVEASLMPPIEVAAEIDEAILIGGENGNGTNGKGGA